MRFTILLVTILGISGCKKDTDTASLASTEAKQDITDVHFSVVRGQSPSDAPKVVSNGRLGDLRPGISQSYALLLNPGSSNFSTTMGAAIFNMVGNALFAAGEKLGDVAETGELTLNGSYDLVFAKVNVSRTILEKLSGSSDGSYYTYFLIPKSQK